MRFICLTCKRVNLLVSSIGICIAGAAAAEDRMCRIEAPEYAIEDDPMEITVTLICDGSGSALPIGTEMLIGMTIYSDPFQDEITRPINALPTSPAGADWSVLGDDYADSYDFALQAFQIDQSTTSLSFEFRAGIADLDEMRHMLTVIWPGSTKETCDPTDDFQRHGCQEYGYLVGADLDSLLIAYPGQAWMTNADPNVPPSDFPRWIVERFR